MAESIISTMPLRQGFSIDPVIVCPQKYFHEFVQKHYGLKSKISEFIFDFVTLYGEKWIITIVGKTVEETNPDPKVPVYGLTFDDRTCKFYKHYIQSFNLNILDKITNEMRLEKTFEELIDPTLNTIRITFYESTYVPYTPLPYSPLPHSATKSDKDSDFAMYRNYNRGAYTSYYGDLQTNKPTPMGAVGPVESNQLNQLNQSNIETRPLGKRAQRRERRFANNERLKQLRNPNHCSIYA